MSQQDVNAARAAVREAEVALRAISILADRDAHDRDHLAKEKFLHEHASYTQINEATRANATAMAAAAAAATAAAATPVLVLPVHRVERPTDGVTRSAVDRVAYDLDKK